MKVFKASVSGGVVKVASGDVVECPIIGQGGDSEGIVVISETELAYIPNTTPDVSTLIGYVEAGFNSVLAGVLSANAGGPIINDSFTSGLNATLAKLAELKGLLK